MRSPGVYGWLDMVPEGRDETGSDTLTDWVKRHDSGGRAAAAA